MVQHTCDVCRFYDPTEGDIQIGNHEIRDVTMSSLRSKFGAVPQVKAFKPTHRMSLLRGIAASSISKTPDCSILGRDI